jgi:type II secretory pathway pseudopilin PulG
VPAGRTGTHEAGFTILEAAVAMAVLAVALLSLWSTLIYCSRSNLAAEQKKRAVNAAQAKIEELKAQDFATLIADYGPGGTIGDTFAVPTLDDSQAVAQGRIVFGVNEPTALGTDGAPLPLDLNGDGDDTDTDVSGDYQLLPVRVVVSWKGALGAQRVDLRTLLRKED